MAIETLVNGLNPLTDQSRIDARSGDVITLNYVGGPFVTIGWELTFTPETVEGTPSSAVLSNTAGPGPITFTIDHEGSYLIRQVVDTGVNVIETYVYVAFLTVFGKLRLVAGGERRDDSKVVPVDAATDGWASEQNRNIKRLLGFVKHVSSSGRIIYVDANRGKDNSNAVDDPDIAEGYADFSSINSAIQAAQFDPDFNGTVAPSPTDPIIVAVRPGLYEEDIVFEPYVHVVAWPGTGGHLGDTDQTVRVKTDSAPHVLNMTDAGHFVHVLGLHFENVESTPVPVLRKVGEGSAYLTQCRVLQNGNSATQGPAISVDVGRLDLDHCTAIQNATSNDEAVALRLHPTSPSSAQVHASYCRFEGRSAAILDDNQAGGTTEANFLHSTFAQIGVGPTSFCVDTFAPAARFDGCSFTMENGAITDAVRGNPGGVGAPGDLLVAIRRSILGDPDGGGTLGINVDDTNVSGTAILQLGSSEYSTSTTGLTVLEEALTRGTSLFYDNSDSGIAATNLQDAVDQVSDQATAIASLDDAYDGYDFSFTPPNRGSGDGRVILADSGAVEIHGSGVATDPPPLEEGDGDGTLRAVSAVEVGAIEAPEIALRANYFGNGPLLQLGRLIWSDSPVGASGFVVAGQNTPGGSVHRNYNLRLQTASGQGNTSAVGSSAAMGSVIVMGGSAYAVSGANSPAGGAVYVLGGNVDSNAVGLDAAAGDIFLAPGHTEAPDATEGFGTIQVTDPVAATGATLEAANDFVDSGVPGAGTVVFATSQGRVAIEFAGGEGWAAVQSLLSTNTGLIATWAGVGNPIILETTHRGPTADITFISDSTGGTLNTYLGDLASGTFTPGGYPNTARMWGSGDQILKLDAVLSMIPVDEAVLIAADETGIFVSDSTGLPYFRDSGGTLYDLTSGAPGAGAPPEAQYVVLATHPGLTAERVLTAGAAIDIADGGAKNPLTISHESSAVTPGSYTNANITVDAQGHVTAASSGVGATAEKLLSRQMLVPVGVASPNIIREYDILQFSAGFTPTAVSVMVNEAILPAGPGNVLIEITVRDNTGALIGDLIDGGPFFADSLTPNVPQSLPLNGALPTPFPTNSTLEIKMEHPNGAPTLTDGDGLVVAITGTA